MRKTTLFFLLMFMLVASVTPILAQEGSIVDIAVADGRFTTLVAAVQAAGLADTLANDGPFTVFAPTDAAFAAAFETLGIEPEALLADTDMLTNILLYHVVDGAVNAETVVGLESATTLEGEAVTIVVRDGNVYLNDTVQVIITDIQASNGIIHVIDGVLVPPSIQEVMAAEPETTHLRVAHFSPDTPAIDVYVNGELSDVQDLSFPAITSWIELPAGSYNIAVAPADTSLEDAAIGPTDFDLPADGWITVAAIGSLEAGTLASQVIVEDYSDIPEGSARVTVFHAIEDAPAVDVLASGSPVISNLAFPGMQGSNDGVFTLEVPAGSYDLQVVPGGATEPVVLDLSGTELTANNHYFVAAVGTLAAPQVALAASDMAVVKPAALGSIVDIAVADGRFTTLVAAVQAAGLADTLANAFAAAFETLGIEPEALLADTDMLTNILLYHVVNGAVNAETVVGLESATTLEGEAVMIVVRDGNVYLNDTVQVIITDIQASNGIIHVIDGVLLPPAS
jgi:transforming growth factor-beta-induced protein